MHEAAPPRPLAQAVVVGTGAMGAAVALRLLEAGSAVAVWNRTPEKLAPLAAKGAIAIRDLGEALQAAPLVLVVLADIPVAVSALGTVADALGGRTVVNFSSGAGDDASALRGLVERSGGRFIRGAITAYPRNVGDPRSCFIYSGDQPAYTASRNVLDRLSGDSMFLSEVDAQALGAAITIQAFVAMGGFYEAIAVAAGLGAEPRSLASNLMRVAPFLMHDAIEDAARRVASEDFAGEQATIDTHVAHIAALARTLGGREVAAPLLDALDGVARQAQDLGYGAHDISALLKSYAAFRG